MSHKTPSWWYDREKRLVPFLLHPISYLYGAAVRYRWSTTKPYYSQFPVVCVGNFTVGGAGKTPTALYLAGLLKELGERPAFLTRGYGGKIKGPHLVNQSTDTSEDVGDEPLLLSRVAPTIVCANRPLGAQFIETLEPEKPSIIIMDDGFQNPTLAKSLNLIVFDGVRGLGNSKVFPAGPLREPVISQLQRTDLVIIIGGETCSLIDKAGIQTINATLSPDGEEVGFWKGKSVLAYSGIAQPEKFYRTLYSLGALLKKTVNFPDHHQFTADDARSLLNQASGNLQLVTTEKDIVRLSSEKSPFSELREKSMVLPVSLNISESGKSTLVNHIHQIKK